MEDFIFKHLLEALYFIVEFVELIFSYREFSKNKPKFKKNKQIIQKKTFDKDYR